VASVLSRPTGADGATMPRLRTVSRLAVIGGFVLLGWLALALVSATKAAADPGPSPQPPSRPATDAGSTRSLLDELPVVRSVVQPLDPELAPIVAPVTPAVDTVVAPVRPAVTSLTQVLAPVTAPVERAVAGVTGRVALLVRPLVKVARGVVGGPSYEAFASRKPAATGLLRAVPKRASGRESPYLIREVSVPGPMRSSLATSRTGGRPPDAQPAGSGRGAAPDAGRPVPIYGGRAPRPDPSPRGPALIGALAAGSAASSRTAQAGAQPGCTIGERWGPPDVRVAGRVAKDRSPAVRNSAAKPSVSPD
jgi:hypothetical protein